MKTLTEQYRLIKEDKGHKGVFLKEAKRQFPNLITNSATFNEASKILKQKNIISENFVGTPMVGNPFGDRKKESYEKAFENFLAEAEAKAEEKKVSKEVEEDQEHAYDNEDKKEPNNMIFGQVQMGYYCEYKDPKNEGKTDPELLEIVYKNLAKDPIYYTKNGQFGEQDLGYTDEAPSLGEPVEPKGEHKSSGYGNLKESKILNEALNKDLKDVGMDIAKYLKEKGLEPKFIQGENLKLYQDFPENGSLLSLMDGGARLEIAVNDSKINILKEIIKKYNLQSLQSLKQTGGWADDPKKKSQSKGEIYLSSDKPQRRGKAFTLELKRFDPSTIKENKKSVNEHSISMAGGIVTGGGFSHMNYMDYFGLNEAEDDKDDTEKIKGDLEDIKKTSDEISKIEMFEEDDVNEMEAPSHIEKLADAAEAAYDAGMDIDEILSMIEQHLGLKMGDY